MTGPRRGSSISELNLLNDETSYSELLVVALLHVVPRRLGGVGWPRILSQLPFSMVALSFLQALHVDIN